MEKIWLKRYPEGVPNNISVELFPSLISLFEQAFSDYRDNTAFINMGQEMSYGELDKKSRDFAAYLQHLGLEKGDGVALMMPNLLQFPIAMIGILRAGLTVINVNPNYTARELKHQLNDSNAQAIIIIENFAHTLQQVVAKTQVKHVILSGIGDMLPRPKNWLVNFTIRHIKKMVPDFSLRQTSSFCQALKQGAKQSYQRPKLTGSDLAFLQYTGGTTGVSKGAMLSHQNILANLEQISAFLSPLISTGKDTVVTALPLYHIFALVANCLIFLKYGCANLLITDPRNMSAFVKALGKVRFTAITGVNTLFNGLLNTPEFARLDFSQLKFGLGGGMAVQKPVAERWQQTTGSVLIEGYGLTECSPLVTCNPYDIQGYTGSIGLPLPSTEVRLVDEAGKPVRQGQAGEMQVRGRQVMQGYYNRPKATAEILDAHGWLSTGDIATMDEQGFFKIVDRKKDMILVSGFNVFPNEIEEVVAKLENVIEAAAIGIPHANSGEVVKLFVVRNSERLSKEDIMLHCRENLTAYKVPRRVVVLDSLPRSLIGKVLRREIRDTLVAAH